MINIMYFLNKPNYDQTEPRAPRENKNPVREHTGLFPGLQFTVPDDFDSFDSESIKIEAYLVVRRVPECKQPETQPSL
jgi:hypothetical protein